MGFRLKKEWLFVFGFCVAFLPTQSSFAKAKPNEVGYFTDADQLKAPATNGVRYFHPKSKPYYAADTKQGTLVDLHMHVFEHGLGAISKGDFYDNALTASWDSRFENKINEIGLDTSGLGLVVVALYGHPILEASAKSSVREQIARAQKFVQDYPNWVIAKNSAEATQAQAQGKNILVFSIEGADGMLNSEADLEEFIDTAGVSIVTFEHLIDDDLGGVALQTSYGILANLGAAFESWSHGHEGKNGELLNTQGLTLQGRQLAQKLIERKVWIDLAHASEETAKGLIPLLKKAGQPLLYTHGTLRTHTLAERSFSKEQLQAVKESGGIIGLWPSESVVGEIPVPKKLCPKKCASACDGGVFSLAVLFNEAVDQLGSSQVFLGADLNGAMDHLKPNSCALGSSLDTQGYANVSQTEDLWRDLKLAGAKSEENQKNGVKNFIQVWSKVR